MRPIYILAALIVIVAMLLIADMARAQGMCQPYAVMVKSLKERYGETSLGKGVSAETIIIEIFASPDTFTILATNTSGVACMIAAGKGWQTAPKFLGDDT